MKFGLGRPNRSSIGQATSVAGHLSPTSDVGPHIDENLPQLPLASGTPDGGSIVIKKFAFHNLLERVIDGYCADLIFGDR